MLFQRCWYAHVPITEYPLLKKTAVAVKNRGNESIHMNKLKDYYYKHDIYISQASTKEEFPKFLEAILQEWVRPG